MAVSKLPRVVSLFKTTLAQGISTADTSVTLQNVPGGVMEYPNWLVIDPDSANAEIIYLPTPPTGNTYTGIVRNISKNTDSDAGATGIGHGANVDVLLGPTHRHLNEIIKALNGMNGTGSNTLRIGTELDTDIFIYAQNADGSKPFVKYDAALNKWLISNDGISTVDIAAGGSGVSSGLGVSIAASLANLDVRTTGGLRNNQGTGSRQADVDPTIVARLDTANTWTGVQSFAANKVTLSTDPVAGTEPIRLSYLTSLLNGNVDKQPYGDGSDGAVTFDGSTTYPEFSTLSSGVYTLTRNVYATTCVLSGTAIVNESNAEVFASVSITRTGTAKFRNNGIAAIGSSGAIAKAGITLPGQPTGGNGGGGSSNNSQGGAGGSGTAITLSLLGSGVGGGAGGAGSGGGPGPGGGGAAAPLTKRLPHTVDLATWFFDYITGTLQVIQTSSGAGGGGGGWGTGASGSTGGGGGGGGGPAGIVKVSAPTITDSGTGTMFEAIGGAGAAATAATGGTIASGGGGGGGGNGGIIIRIYHTLTGSAPTAVTGGAGGVGGAGVVGGGTGVTGTTGAVGAVYDIVV